MENKIDFELVTPTEVLVSEGVEMVVIPGADGDIGVLPSHSLLLSNIRAGLVNIYNEGEISKKLFVEGGFVEVTSQRCTLLATAATGINGITTEGARSRLKNAEESLETADVSQKKSAEIELETARALVFAAESNTGAS